MKHVPVRSTPSPICLIWKSPIPGQRRVQVIGLNNTLVGYVDAEAFKTEIVWPLRSQLAHFQGFATVDGTRVFDLIAFVNDRRTRTEVLERMVIQMGTVVADAIADIHAAHRAKTAPTRALNTIRRQLRACGAAIRTSNSLPN
ncbi:MAG: hypothetical protein EXS55_01955 [Candidatus Magasanikbacteria bacterium]|nr:hypothetical protein [Candidatus Magasanikbacteria bacterium]